MPPEPKYYEAHITIEPVFGKRFEAFEKACEFFNFKPAELLMQKQRQATPIRSNKDSFATGHGKDFEALKQRTEMLAEMLIEDGFKVWRMKIEAVVYDIKKERLISIMEQIHA